MAEKSNTGVLIRAALAVCALAAAGAGAAYWYMQAPPLAVTAQPVARGRVEETVAAISSGTVIAANSARVASAGMGTIAVVHVEDGQAVKAGDLLVELEHAELDAQVQVTQANLKAGQSRLEQARVAGGIYADVADTRVKQAAAQLDSVKVDYERVKRLADQKAVSQSDFDKVALALRVAQETYAAAKASQEENRVRAEEVVMAESAIEQLHAAIAAAEAMREKAFVRAPFDGVVTRVLLKRGEAVAMGLPLLEMVSVADSHIEAPFDEANLGKIKVGQRARIALDAYPGETFDGEVFYVAPAVTVGLELSRTVPVKVRAAGGAERLVPGMSADVTILADAKDDVLQVPTDSLIRDEFVYLVEGGKVARRDVTLGIGNWESREIVSGLSGGEQLITSVAVKGIGEGTPVRVVEALE